MIIAGIDPGVTGAIAALSIRDGRWEFVGGRDMPVQIDGKRKRVDAAELNRWLLYYDPDRYLLEKVGPMPGQGVVSMFSFGYSVGIIEGIIGTLKRPLVMVPPRKWKQAAGLIGTEKSASLTVARRLFPDAPLSRKKDVALADAILIAYFGEQRPDAAKP